MDNENNSGKETYLSPLFAYREKAKKIAERNQYTRSQSYIEKEMNTPEDDLYLKDMIEHGQIDSAESDSELFNKLNWM